MGIFFRSHRKTRTSDEVRMEGVKARYEASIISIESTPVNEILSTPNFVYTYYKTSHYLDEPPTKDTEFKVVRFVYRNDPPDLFDFTHGVIVVRAKGTKEYEASIQVVDGIIVKSFVNEFYG